MRAMGPEDLDPLLAGEKRSKSVQIAKSLTSNQGQ